jgi:hypothetical protein
MGSSFVEPSDRIATFDNDGTLWVERLMPPQFDFLFQTWAIEAQEDPSLASEQPYKAIIEKDVAYFQGLVTQDPKVVMLLEQADIYTTVIIMVALTTIIISIWLKKSFRNDWFLNNREVSDRC